MTENERERMAKIEEKIDNIIKSDKQDEILATLTRLDVMMDNFIKCKEDHETRIRVLENKPSKRWDVAVIAVITAVVGGVIGAVIAFFS